MKQKINKKPDCQLDNKTDLTRSQTRQEDRQADGQEYKMGNTENYSDEQMTSLTPSISSFYVFFLQVPWSLGVEDRSNLRPSPSLPSSRTRSQDSLFRSKDFPCRRAWISRKFRVSPEGSRLRGNNGGHNMLMQPRVPRLKNMF